ncbi:MAG: chemotaxis protein CheW [Myxococcota bacterium]
MENQQAGDNGVGEQYLTFALDTEQYGIRITHVKEILGLLPLTRVPRTRPDVRGVVNLRGKIIPIVDMRRKFGLPDAEDTRSTCIIVVPHGPFEIGIVVDSVSEVVNIPDGQIDEPPDMEEGSNTRFLMGIARTTDGIRLLLNIDEVLSENLVDGDRSRKAVA